MIAILPCPSADRSTIRERQTTFRDGFPAWRAAGYPVEVVTD